MTDEQSESVVARLADGQARNPDGDGRKVLRPASAGCAYIAALQPAPWKCSIHRLSGRI